MKDDTGVTLSRVLRKEYEEGKKPPASADYVTDLGFFHAVTRVLLPGKKNRTTFIEFKPQGLQALITSIQFEEQEVRKKLIVQKTRQKTRKIKEQAKVITEQDKQIHGSTQKIEELTRLLGQANRDTHSAENKLARARSEVHEQQTGRMDARGQVERLKSELWQRDREIDRLRSELADAKQTNRNMQKVNQDLGKRVNTPGNEDANPPMVTPSTRQSTSTTKLRSPKPYPSGGVFR